MNKFQYTEKGDKSSCEDISVEALRALHKLAWGSFESKRDLQEYAFDAWNKLFDVRNKIGERDEGAL